MHNMTIVIRRTESEGASSEEEESEDESLVDSDDDGSAASSDQVKGFSGILIPMLYSSGSDYTSLNISGSARCKI